MTHAVTDKPIVEALGTQLIIEMHDCHTESFDDLEWVKQTLIEAAKRAQATIVDVMFHKFSPIGISGVVVISESHFAIHTWPEHRYAALDIFTCGTVLDSNAAIAYITQHFRSTHYEVTSLSRGLMYPKKGRHPRPVHSHAAQTTAAPDEKRVVSADHPVALNQTTSPSVALFSECGASRARDR